MLILKTGSALPSIRKQWGDFDHWIMAHAGLNREDSVVVDAATIEELPAHNDFCGVIITGSPAMVTDNSPWIKRAAKWISGTVGNRIPLFGICFGHQLLAHAMGGEVDDHPGGREIGTVSVHLTPAGQRDTLFGGMPATFPAHTTHAQTIIKLPPGAHCLASNPFEAHHAFRIGPSAWGVQFHPEFSVEVMHAYINAHSAKSTTEGGALSALQAGVTGTAAASALLRKFNAYCHHG